jgi:hypothetical protein
MVSPDSNIIIATNTQAIPILPSRNIKTTPG